MNIILSVVRHKIQGGRLTMTIWRPLHRVALWQLGYTNMSREGFLTYNQPTSKPPLPHLHRRRIRSDALNRTRDTTGDRITSIRGKRSGDKNTLKTKAKKFFSSSMRLLYRYGTERSGCGRRGESVIAGNRWGPRNKMEGSDN